MVHKKHRHRTKYLPKYTESENALMLAYFVLFFNLFITLLTSKENRKNSNFYLFYLFLGNLKISNYAYRFIDFAIYSPICIKVNTHVSFYSNAKDRQKNLNFCLFCHYISYRLFLISILSIHVFVFYSAADFVRKYYTFN